MLVALFALGACDSLSHPFDDPDPPQLPNPADYDRSCNLDTDCTAVNGGDCGCQVAVGINVKDAARFEMDFVSAQNGDACRNFNGQFCFGPQSGTITPVCVLSVHQCVAVFCDSSNNCMSN